MRSKLSEISSSSLDESTTVDVIHRSLATNDDETDDYLSNINNNNGWYEGTIVPSNYHSNRSSDYSSSSSYTWYLWGNIVKASNTTELQKAADVSVDAVVTSIYFNTVVFILLMIFYECLRRMIPSVYSSRKRMHHMQAATAPINQKDSDDAPPATKQMYEEDPPHPVVSYFDPNAEKHMFSDRIVPVFADENDDYDDNNSNVNTTTPRPSSNDTPTSSALFGTTPAAAFFRTSLAELRCDDPNYVSSTKLKNEHLHRLESKSSLPDSRPLDWIQPVLGVPWSKVLQSAGLDGYFFLRYIRMCVRITAVSTFWFFLILIPAYATGSSSSHSKPGWYHLSVENIPTYGWRMWLASVFLYLFSFFIFFVVKQEYRHYLEIRQDFLAKGSAHVHPQHHYSLLVESIPYELRSDRALADYFNKLFPGKVHSASVVLKLPDLERASARCLRSCRRLEKSIALLMATGKRPTHVVGRARVNLLGIELQPVDCTLSCGDTVGDDDSVASYPDEEISMMKSGEATVTSNILGERPKRGTRVDSISYYTHELAMHSRALYRMQQRKVEIAEIGNTTETIRDSWFDAAMREATVMANQILDDSALDNDLVTPTDTQLLQSSPDIAENMTSRYGSISHGTLFDHQSQSKLSVQTSSKNLKGNAIDPFGSTETDRKQHLMDTYVMDGTSPNQSRIQTPFGSDQYSNVIRRYMGRFGLDFFIAIVKFLHGQLDSAFEGVMNETMASTGMVTFLDLSSVACAASAPLTTKASILNVKVAPEPREIIWENAHVSSKTQMHRKNISNCILLLGVVLWSFPLAFIQAVAKVDVIAQFPGMEWLVQYNGGNFSRFINGYLPVCALLTLIMILPIIFEYIAVKFEHRKTLSEVQASMVERYFNFQLVNIYVTVTAGSLLVTLTDIVNHPLSILEMGKSLPTMAGYFVALLVTKILAGLPMIFLRFGALMRMLFLKLLANERKLTQREVDAVYRLENVQYGWEFPTQLLVVVIVFTYAIMCPVILPVGMIYFMGALIVYKKQILYVYSPVYESGGALFPLAVQRTLFGLVCAQVTFLGYIVTRGCHHQPLFLAPLPVLTIITANYFQRTYADPSKRLSLERARAFDRPTMENGDSVIESRRAQFDKNFYRQPVLTEVFREPWTYRRGIRDEETIQVREELRRMNRTLTQNRMNNVLGALKMFKSNLSDPNLTR